jgi:ribosomal protein S14
MVYNVPRASKGDEILRLMAQLELFTDQVRGSRRVRSFGLPVKIIVQLEICRDRPRRIGFCGELPG